MALEDAHVRSWLISAVGKTEDATTGAVHRQQAVQCAGSAVGTVRG
jgi:hypothetical protein